MGIFNKAIPKYTRNLIDNSLVVEPVEEPVTVVDDVYDPILNKAVRERLMSTYGNPIGATLGGYYELINNAFMGNKHQGGTMLPGIGVLSSFGRSMDKTGDIILGTLTEATKGLTGQGVESPLYNIFTEDEDYSGQRYLAAAANSMAKLANAPTLTEDDFGGVWTIPSLGIDLATDPSILGGNLTKIAKGQGAVAEAGEILKAYDDVASNFAIDMTAPGFRQAVSKFIKMFDNKVGFSSQEALRDFDFNYNKNVNTVIKARQIMRKAPENHPDFVKASEIWNNAPNEVREYVDSLDAVKTILDDNTTPEAVAEAIEIVQGTPDSARKAIFDKFRDVDWKRKQFILSDPNSFEQIPLDIQNIPNVDTYNLNPKEVNVTDYTPKAVEYQQLNILDILKYGEDKLVTPKTGRKYVPIEMSISNFRAPEIEDYDTYATSQPFINSRIYQAKRKEKFKKLIKDRDDRLYGGSNSIDDIARRHGGTNTVDEIVYTPILKPNKFSEKFGYDPVDLYVTAEINGELKHLDYSTWESTVSNLQDELAKLEPDSEEYANKLIELNSWLKAIDDEGTAVYGFTKEYSKTKNGKLANLTQSRYNTLDPKTATLAVQIAQSELKPFINKWQQLGLIPKFSNEYDITKWINSDPNIRAISQGNSYFKDLLTVLFLKPGKKDLNSIEYLKTLENFYKNILELRRYDDKWYSDILSDTITPELINAYKDYSKTGLPIGEVNRRVKDMYASTYPKGIGTTDYAEIRHLEQQRQPIHYEFKNLFERAAYEKMYEDLEGIATDYFNEILNPIDRVIDDGLNIVDTTRASAYSLKESADWGAPANKGHIKTLANESGLARADILPEGTSGRFLYKNDINTDRYSARVDKPYQYQRTFNNVLEKYMSKLTEYRSLKAKGDVIPDSLNNDLRQLTNDLTWFAERYSFKTDNPDVEALLKKFREKHVEYKKFDELDSSYNIGAIFNKPESEDVFKQFTYKKSKPAKGNVVIEYPTNKDSFDFIVGDSSNYAYIGGKYADTSKLHNYTDLSALNLDRSYWRLANSQKDVVDLYRSNFITNYKTKPEFKKAFDKLIDMYSTTGEVHLISEAGEKGHAAVVKEFLEKAIEKQVKEIPIENLVDEISEIKIPSPPITKETIKEYQAERNKIFTRKVQSVKDSYVNLNSDTLSIKAFKPEDIATAKANNVIQTVIPESRGYTSNPDDIRLLDEFLSKDKNTLFRYLSKMSNQALHSTVERKTLSLNVDNAKTLLNDIDQYTSTPGASVRASIYTKTYRDFIDRTKGDVVNGSNLIDEMVFSNALEYIKATSDFKPGELARIKQSLTNNVQKLNKELGMEVFKVYETDLGKYHYIALGFNGKEQAINKANWKKALKANFEDVVFHSPESLVESTDPNYLEVKNFMRRINDIVVDQGKFLGFDMPTENYVKHVMTHNDITAEFLSKIREQAGMPNDDILDAIHYSIMKTGLFNDRVGSFFIDPNARRLRGIASQYDFDGVNVFDTELNKIAKSSLAEGMFADNNFQTIWGVFKSGTFTLSNYVNSDDELVKMLDLYGNSGNASNLQLVKPKYNEAGRIIGFQRFDKFSQLSRAQALQDSECVIMDNAVLSIYDGVLRRQKALNNKAFTWINQHLTLPFKLGCLMNPGFLFGNMGDAITKQAVTMATKYGTSPVEEIAKIYEAHRAVVNLNNEFDEIYQIYLKQLENAGYEITGEYIPQLLTKDKKATEQFLKYLNGDLLKPGVAYSTLPEDRIVHNLTERQLKTADVYLFMKSIQGGSFIDVDIKDANKLRRESFRPAYYKKSLWDRVTLGSGNYNWKDPRTWGIFQENPVSSNILKASEGMESYMREAMIYNDLMHSGISLDDMRQYIGAFEGSKDYEDLRIGILNAMNTMHSANFDYANITDTMDFASKYIPFPTFYMKNLAYWLNMFVNHPQYIDTILDINEGLWANEDTEDDEFKADAKARGAIPLSAVSKPSGQKLSKFFRGIYKPSPFQSLFSAASALNNPIETTVQRIHPVIQGGIQLAGKIPPLNNLTTNLQNPEDVRYRPYNTNQYQPNIDSTEEEFNPLVYTFHKLNPLDRTLNTGLRTPGKIKKGEAQLSDFLPSVFQPDFSKK